METLTDIGAANAAITRFLIENAAKLPEDVREKAIELNASPSPVDRICGVAELLFARKEDAGQAGRKLAAQLALFAAPNGWQGMREGRGERIAWAMMRRNGYDAPAGVTFPDVDDDPAPDPRYIEETA